MFSILLSCSQSCKECVFKKYSEYAYFRINTEKKYNIQHSHLSVRYVFKRHLNNILFFQITHIKTIFIFSKNFFQLNFFINSSTFFFYQLNYNYFILSTIQCKEIKNAHIIACSVLMLINLMLSNCIQYFQSKK